MKNSISDLFLTMYRLSQETTSDIELRRNNETFTFTFCEQILENELIHYVTYKKKLPNASYLIMEGLPEDKEDGTKEPRINWNIKILSPTEKWQDGETMSQEEWQEPPVDYSEKGWVIDKEKFVEAVNKLKKKYNRVKQLQKDINWILWWFKKPTKLL